MQVNLKETFSNDVRFLNDFYKRSEDRVCRNLPMISPRIIHKEIKRLRDRHIGVLRKDYLRKIKRGTHANQSIS